MPKTLGNIFTEISTDISNEDGTVSNAVKLLAVNDALEEMQAEWELPTTEYTVPIDVFRGYYTYPCPPGFKSFNALRQNNVMRDFSDFTWTVEDDFWRNYRISNLISDHWDGNQRSLLITLITQGLPSQIVDPCNQYNIVGTWVADVLGSDAANVQTDYEYFRPDTNSSSVRFDILVGQNVADTADIFKTNLGAIDLSSPYLSNVAVLFLDLYLPNSVAYTSWVLDFGSSTSDYYSVSVASQYNGFAFAKGWNTLGFDWTNATTTGTPDNSKITFLRLRANYGASMANQYGIRINNLRAQARLLMNLSFLSEYIVTDGTTGLPKEKFTNEFDFNSYLNIPPEFENLVRFKANIKIFSQHIDDQAALTLNATRAQTVEEMISSKYPSKRQSQVVVTSPRLNIQNRTY